MAEFGDPSTPRFPSTKSAYRIPTEEMDVFPVLPLTPINYGDAETLLKYAAYCFSLIGVYISSKLKTCSVKKIVKLYLLLLFEFLKINFNSSSPVSVKSIYILFSCLTFFLIASWNALNVTKFQKLSQ